MPLFVYTFDSLFEAGVERKDLQRVGDSCFRGQTWNFCPVLLIINGRLMIFRSAEDLLDDVGVEARDQAGPSMGAS